VLNFAVAVIAIIAMADTGASFAANVVDALVILPLTAVVTELEARLLRRWLHD
jgi:hypothetical protein